MYELLRIKIASICYSKCCPYTAIEDLKQGFRLELQNSRGILIYERFFGAGWNLSFVVFPQKVSTNNPAYMKKRFPSLSSSYSIPPVHFLLLFALSFCSKSLFSNLFLSLVFDFDALFPREDDPFPLTDPEKERAPPPVGDACYSPPQLRIKASPGTKPGHFVFYFVSFQFSPLLGHSIFLKQSREILIGGPRAVVDLFLSLTLSRFPLMLFCLVFSKASALFV